MFIEVIVKTSLQLPHIQRKGRQKERVILEKLVLQAVPGYLEASGRMLRSVRKNNSVVFSILFKFTVFYTEWRTPPPFSQRRTPFVNGVKSEWRTKLAILSIVEDVLTAWFRKTESTVEI